METSISTCSRTKDVSKPRVQELHQLIVKEWTALNKLYETYSTGSEDLRYSTRGAQLMKKMKACTAKIVDYMKELSIIHDKNTETFKRTITEIIDAKYSSIANPNTSAPKRYTIDEGIASIDDETVRKELTEFNRVRKSLSLNAT